MPNAPEVKAPPRGELAAIEGINERVMRYLEALSLGVNDARMQTGTGSPVGVVRSNSSRLYMDISTGDLYKNTSATYGDTVGWVLV